MTLCHFSFSKDSFSVDSLPPILILSLDTKIEREKKKNGGKEKRGKEERREEKRKCHLFIALMWWGMDGDYMEEEK